MDTPPPAVSSGAASSPPPPPPITSVTNSVIPHAGAHPGMPYGSIAAAAAVGYPYGDMMAAAAAANTMQQHQQQGRDSAETFLA